MADKDDKRSQSRADASRARRAQRDKVVRRIPRSRTPSDVSSPRQRHDPSGGRTVWRNSPQSTSRPSTRRGKRQWQTAIAAVPQLTGELIVSLHPTWRWASATIVVLYLGVLLHFMTSPEFFVDSINLGGAYYIPGDQVYNASGVHFKNMFWLDPEEIHSNIATMPGIRDVEVSVIWPNEITVQITEREPVLIWSQGGQRVWVDIEGNTFDTYSELPDLMPIQTDDQFEALSVGATVPPSAVAGALQLRELRPNIELLHYDAHGGLSYQDGRGWRAYFGTGTDMEIKLTVYEALVTELVAQRIFPTSIDVTNPETPIYYK